MAEVEAGKFTRTSATVGQMLDKWLADTEDRQRPRTVYENKRKIEARIRPVLGDVRLDKLDREPDIINTAYRRWLAEGLAPATVHKYHSILSAACGHVVKLGWMDRSPTKRATAPSLTRKQMVVPTPEQLTALVKAAGDDPMIATAVALAALTGVRRGELVALRFSDIDLAKGTVRIARSLTVARGEQHTGPTKTHQARDLALDPVCLEVLQRRWAYMVDLSERAESPLVADPYVLSYNANAGVPVNPDTLTHGFGALCEAMEAPALKRLRNTKPKAKRTDLAPRERWPFRFHDLRHFSVTILIAAGTDIRTVSERHGHARATMTLDRYAHALPERDREAAGVLGQALGW
ncbi:MAG TPA: site-specific integrase [Acidimicrobiales bacterium]|nr:site-specific integrase [Acidimicrobiales bacterium]